MAVYGVANPKAKEKLRQLGFDVEGGGPPSLELFIQRHFSPDARERALQRLKELPERPGIAAPSIMSLYDEIWQAILLDLNGAAIVLCGNLIEYTLKYAIYTCQAGGFGRYKPEDWALVERLSLDRAIRTADTHKLLTKDQKKILIEFKEVVRDPYSHHNIQKIVKGSVAGKVQVVNLGTGQVEERDIDADQELAIAAQVKPLVDEANAIRHFKLAHQVVCTMYSQLLERFDEGE